MDKTKISIVIASRNRYDDLKRCIKSISSQIYLPYEIIVIDQSDIPYSVEGLTNEKPASVFFIHERSVPGLCKARNIGAKLAKGDIVLFIDDDVILEQDYIQQISLVFQHDTSGKVAGVTGNITNLFHNSHSIRNRIGRILLSCFFTLRSGNGKFQLSGWPTVPTMVDKITQTETLPGNNFAVRKDILIKYLFDERLDYFTYEDGRIVQGIAYVDDNDFSYRVSRDYILVHNPFAKLIHNVSRINRAKQYFFYRKTVVDSYYLLHKNFDVTLTRRMAFWLSVLGLIIMALLSKQGFFQSCRGIIHGVNDCAKHHGNAKYV